MRPVVYLNTTFFTDHVTSRERLAGIQAHLNDADAIERVASWLVVAAWITCVIVVWVSL